MKPISKTKWNRAHQDFLDTTFTYGDYINIELGEERTKKSNEKKNLTKEWAMRIYIFTQEFTQKKRNRERERVRGRKMVFESHIQTRQRINRCYAIYPVGPLQWSERTWSKTHVLFVSSKLFHSVSFQRLTIAQCISCSNHEFYPTRFQYKCEYFHVVVLAWNE